jgi:hypothetical protein
MIHRAAGDAPIDDPWIIAVALLALAVLAGAILLIKHMERKDDVITGGYVRRDDEYR